MQNKQISLTGESVDEETLEEETIQPPGGFVGRTQSIDGTPFHISKIKIKNFKAISEIEVHFPRISVLTGPNNSGKSTILQAISLGFECLARNIDVNKKIKRKGSVVQELASVPVNHPKNLWHNNKWVQSRDHIPIEIRIDFTNASYFTSQINYYYGIYNFKVKEYSDDLKNTDILKKLVNSTPVLIPGIPTILRHEQPQLVSIISSYLSYGLHAQVLRNVLINIKKRDPERFKIIEEAINHHFNIELSEIIFDENSSLEIIAPYDEKGNEFEIISGGSGFHQILQLLSFLIWSESSIVLLDEPDAHLHTSLQKKLYLFLDDLSKKLNLQLIISTHSRDFLASSPIHSIIPVNLSEPLLKPMESIEHLLSEFKRQGEISNLEIASLYSSKSCLFVEGGSDEDILINLAEKFENNIFTGKKHAITIPIKGKDRIKEIPNLIGIFEKMIGTEIKWFVIRDRDALAPEILKEFEVKLNNSGIKNYHIWTKYELENYLCETKPITRIIRSEGKTISEAEVDKLIFECCNEGLDKYLPIIITENQTVARSLDIKNWSGKGAEYAVSYTKDANKSKDHLLELVPGKEVLGRLFVKIQENYGVNLRAMDIAREIQKDEIHPEIHELFDNLSSTLSK